jgi:hypothetical protein
MDKRDRKQYIRLIYGRTFSYLGIMCVIALLVGALLGGGVFMVNAMCAFGFVMLCWGWFTYLKMTGMRPFRLKKREKKASTPYILRRFKEKKWHKPSFRMESEDFDDDLTSSTVAKEENFTQKQVDTARAIARAVCGAIMVAISFLM